MTDNTRADLVSTAPAQGQSLRYGDAADEPVGSGAGPSRREFLAPGDLEARPDRTHRPCAAGALLDHLAWGHPW